MSDIARVGALLILTMILAGCAPMTPAERAALEEQDRRSAMECERLGRVYVSGSCISRGGGA
jgi:PBP1b-binding outer membrane lipoprotein LpoB